MKKIICLLFLLPVFLATTCKTKEMDDNSIIVENKHSSKVFLLPHKIKYDYYKMEFTKKRLIHNYSVEAESTAKIFHTPFCDKTFWDRSVISDTLEILVFIKDSLDKYDTLEEVISNESYVKKVKFTYEQLINDNCKLVIEQL